MEFLVGTFLAVVPIVIEAYDRYWDLSEGFGTFRHHSRELAKLDIILRTQKTLFRGNVVKLLTEITHDQEKARALLSDGCSANWAEIKIPELLANDRLQSIRETFSSWEETLRLVVSSVQNICLELESFRTGSSGEVLRQLPKRFRLCWRKREVQDAIKELREFTADFNELTNRIVNELKDIRVYQPVIKETAPRQQTKQLNSLEKYRRIQAASDRLYKTFAVSWSCERHRCHSACISLGDALLHPISTAQDGITFAVAIDSNQDQSRYQDAPIWLEVESVAAIRSTAILTGDEIDIQEEPVRGDDTANEWANTLDRIGKHSQPLVVERVERVHKKLAKKAVRFQTAQGGDAAIETVTTVTMVEPADVAQVETATTLSSSIEYDSPEPITDLEQVADLCHHFQLPRQSRAYTPIGYIKDLGIHRFYLAPPERRLPGEQKSLADIISWISEDDISRSLPRLAMVHLASSLAAAVLQYHSTPWLPETWQSSHVRFFGIGELSEDAEGVSITSPYFRVDLSKPSKGKGKNIATFPEQQHDRPSEENVSSSMDRLSLARTSSTTTALARNELLYRFGIVLLELAYSRPWDLLRQQALRKLPALRQTDYHAAEALAQRPALRDRMGPRFPVIVRKCLGCDFGLGETDLGSEELQGIFLVDVVSVLQEAERGLMELERRL